MNEGPLQIREEEAGEESYWKEQYRNEPYFDTDYSFDDYAPAYRIGWENHLPGISFENTEGLMAVDWERARGTSRLDWEQARAAARAGYHRIGRPRFDENPPVNGGSGESSPTDFHRGKLRDYEDHFGPYNDDDYRSPAQCPESRRALVAEIKVSAAAKTLATHLGQYAGGTYPLPFTEDLSPLFRKIADWDPHLPRDQSPSTISSR